MGRRSCLLSLGLYRRFRPGLWGIGPRKAADHDKIGRDEENTGEDPGNGIGKADGAKAEEPCQQKAYQAARDALAGADPSGGAIYYFNPVTATNAWIWSRPEIITIGKHRFCA